MSTTTRAIRASAIGTALLPLLALVLYGGCGDDDGATTDGVFDSGFMSPDMGPSSRDASSPRPDADTPAPLPPPPASDAGVSPPPGAPDASPEEACGNLEADEPGGLDCADESTCGGTPICCADSVNPGCCAPVPAAQTLFDFADCFARASGCLDELDVAGSPTPRDQLAGTTPLLWLGGDADAEGVVLARAELDPSGVLEATASVVILAGCESPGACAETVAVGLTESTDAADAVESALAVVVSLDTAQVLLVQGRAVLARRALSTAARAMTLAARLTSDGRLVGLIDGEELVAVDVDQPPRRALRAVLFGRGGNGSANHAFVSSLATSGSACDRPRAFVIDDAPVELRQLVGGASANVDIERIVGAEASDGTRRFVISERGTLRAAQPGPDGAMLVDVEGAGALVPAIDGAAPTLAGLEARSATEWVLYVVLASGELVSFTGDGTTFASSAPASVTSASALGVSAIEQPSIVRSADGALVLAFVSRDGGRAEIRTATETSGTWVLDDDAIAPGESAASFDRDGVSAPAVVASRGLVEVYYAGRRSVSESIGLARRSGPRNPWIRYGEGPVLAPGSAAWTNIAVGAPSIVLGASVDGVAALDVYFSGYDGAERALGRAHRLVRR